MTPSPGSVLLEICLDSAASARAAQAGGAHRVELCDRLDLGGTTPSEQAVREAREAISIALYVMIRPRGGDFCYDDGEFSAMKEQIASAKRAGADGVVIGLLRRDASVDAVRTAALVRLAKPLGVTFHRAFDACRDPLRSLEDIIACGAERILSSGCRTAAAEGASLLAELVGMSRGRIAIMPGAGIDITNAAELVRRTGAGEIHVGTAAKTAPGGIVDPERVRRLLESLGQPARR